MLNRRMGDGLGDSLGLSLKYFAQKVTTELVLQQGAHVSAADRLVLQTCAKRVAELAARPIEAEKKRLWRRHNSLQPERPMVVCDPENGWYEIITQDQIQCRGALARVLEFSLRKTIYWGQTMQDDTVIAPVFRSHHIFEETPRGFDKRDIGAGGAGAYTWVPGLSDLRDIARLKPSTFIIHEKESGEYHALLQDIFDGILDVRQNTMWWNSFGMTDSLVFLVGMERLMYLFYDDPEAVHAIMAFLRDEMLAKFHYAEAHGLLYLNNDDSYVGTGGYGWAEELPGPGFAGQPRLCDLWGLSESQETVGVAPEMFGEFIFPYQLPLQEKFGLNCYGCCEPVNARWKYLEKIPRLRRVSVSPWADEAVLAEAMAGRYIYSRKPPSTWLAAPRADWETMRAGIAKTVTLAGRGSLELIMKDNHTLCGNPQNCLDYVAVCREVIDKKF